MSQTNTHARNAARVIGNATLLPTRPAPRGPR